LRNLLCHDVHQTVSLEIPAWFVALERRKAQLNHHGADVGALELNGGS
jgi:hypothetical protein